MRLIIDASEVRPADRPRVGGKGYALAALIRQGFSIPKPLLITTEAMVADLPAEEGAPAAPDMGGMGGMGGMM